MRIVEFQQLTKIHLLRGMLLFGACLVLAGCAATNAPLTANPATIAAALADAKAAGLKWEVGVLEDGKITPAENEAAADRFAKCIEKLGYVMDEPKYLDPVNEQQWRVMATYKGAGKAPDDKMNACSDRWSIIETPFVLSTPRRMDPRLLARYRQCLDQEKLPYKGDETSYNDFTKDLNDHDFAYGPYFDCLTVSMKDVFPNVVGVGVGR